MTVPSRPAPPPLSDYLPTMLAPLVLAFAWAAEPLLLKELWRAAGASSQTEVVADARGTALLSLIDTGSTRSLVRVDAVSGIVLWQTDVVPGVGWGSFAVRGDDVLMQGAPLTGGSAQVAVVSLASGERRWTRQVGEADRLEFGQHGGLALAGACALTPLTPKGADIVTFRGVQENVDAYTRLCVARPRLLGEVADRAIVAVPETASSWRLDAVGADRTGWTAHLGALEAAPEVDWRTGVFWAPTAVGLKLRRYNLATGQLAWESVRSPGDCVPVLRPVEGSFGAPAILMQACDVVTVVDPHDGKVMWEVVDGHGDAIVGPESFALPEWIQPSAAGRDLRWLDGNGRPVGAAKVAPGSFGVPVREGVLMRSAQSVTLLGLDGTVIWSIVLANPRWALMGELLVLAPELGETRFVVQRSTGVILGRFIGGEAIGMVGVPRSVTGRIVLTQGAELRALKVVVRP